MQPPPEPPQIPPPPGAPPPPPQQYGHPYAPYEPHRQVAPFGYYGAPVPNDSKAVTALVFGILSMICFGILAGVPAIVLGLLARRDIERSGGAVGGGGMATAGIALGALSSLLTIGSILLMVVPMFFGGLSYSSSSSSSPVPPPAYTAPTYMGPGPGESENSVPSPGATPPSAKSPSANLTRGALKVIEAHRGSGSLERQLMEAVSHAKAKGRGVLVETAAQSSASREFDASLYDRRMQRALSAVDLVRIDIDEFAPELANLRMYTEAVPYFYKIDASARPTDAISADEWDENVPQNMAPVLESFVAGTLRQRRAPSPLGTTL